MPSQTFFNLDKEKQHKLIDAAMSEFTKVAYPEVSINKIIMNAKIPRGSFYMYFKDKEDLFEYLMDINQKRLNTVTKNTFRNNKGDLYLSFKDLYDEILTKICKKEYIGIYKNIFIFFNLRREKFTYPGHQLFEMIKEEIDTNKIKADDLEFIFNMLMHTLFISIADTMKNSNLEQTREQYRRKLDIICYGIYKEENK